VNKHLVCLLMICTAIAGCHPKNTPKAESPVTGLPPGSFARLWTQPLELRNDPPRELHLTKDYVFAYSRDHVVYTIGRSGGDLKFIAKIDVSGGIVRAPILLGEYIVFPASASLQIYNSRGWFMKAMYLESPTGASGVGKGTVLYIGVNQLRGFGRIVAVDITHQTSVPLWSVLTRGAILGRPAMFERTIYVGSDDGSLVAVDEARGSAAWANLPNGVFTTRGEFISDIIADDYGVYAANTDSKLYCLDRGNGRIKWQYYAGTALKTAPAVTADTVYQYVDGKGIVALNKQTSGFNQARWHVPDTIQLLSEDSSHAYLRRSDDAIVAVDKQTGKVLFTSKKKQFHVFATNTTDAIIYAAAPDGQIVAIRPVLGPGEAGEMVLDVRPLDLLGRKSG
jgi:outer membrane protein assembly factor BamB